MKTPAAAEGQVPAAFARRAARAEALRTSCRVASEPLGFAANLYRAQGDLAALIGAAHDRSALCGGLPRDLPVFAQAMAPLLRLAAENGPPGLATEARARAADGPLPTLSRLQCFWKEEPESVESHYLSRAVLRPYVEVLRALGIPPDRARGPGLCPFCGGPPWIAARRSEEEAAGARRLLACALCGEEWPLARVRCAACTEEDPEKLPAFQSETRPGVRIEACESCRRYLKSIDLTIDARALPEVDDLCSLEMDLWAQEQGFARVEPGLAGC